eukprot:SM000039S14475  [mRNA]  locus=s39:356181:361419:- [translate_table: standard]
MKRGSPAARPSATGAAAGGGGGGGSGGGAAERGPLELEDFFNAAAAGRGGEDAEELHIVHGARSGAGNGDSGGGDGVGEDLRGKEDEGRLSGLTEEELHGQLRGIDALLDRAEPGGVLARLPDRGVKLRRRRDQLQLALGAFKAQEARNGSSPAPGQPVPKLSTPEPRFSPCLWTPRRHESKGAFMLADDPYAFSVDDSDVTARYQARGNIQQSIVRKKSVLTSREQKRHRAEEWVGALSQKTTSPVAKYSRKSLPLQRTSHHSNLSTGKRRRNSDEGSFAAAGERRMRNIDLPRVAIMSTMGRSASRYNVQQCSGCRKRSPKLHELVHDSKEVDNLCENCWKEITGSKEKLSRAQSTSKEAAGSQRLLRSRGASQMGSLLLQGLTSFRKERRTPEKPKHPVEGDTIDTAVEIASSDDEGDALHSFSPSKAQKGSPGWSRRDSLRSSQRQRLEGRRVAFPAGDPDAVELSVEDLQRLGPCEFLNDTVIDFYIKYLQQPERMKLELRNRLHFFNSFFFKKLTKTVAVERRSPGKANISKWTKGVDIFSKDYLFVPIHDEYDFYVSALLHWSLAIICFPGADGQVSSSRPCLLHLDSMNAGHNATYIFRTLRSYLQSEWARQQVPKSRSPSKSPCEQLPSRTFNPKTLPGRRVTVPQQPNAYDCGCFLLHYVELFLQSVPPQFRPEDIDRMNLFGQKWFRPEEATNLRYMVRQLVKDLLQGVNEASRKVSNGPQEKTLPESGFADKAEIKEGRRSAVKEEAEEDAGPSDRRNTEILTQPKVELHVTTALQKSPAQGHSLQAEGASRSSAQVAGGDDSSERAADSNCSEEESDHGTPSKLPWEQSPTLNVAEPGGKGVRVYKKRKRRQKVDWKCRPVGRRKQGREWEGPQSAASLLRDELDASARKLAQAREAAQRSAGTELRCLVPTALNFASEDSPSASKAAGAVEQANNSATEDSPSASKAAGAIKQVIQ